MSTGQLGGGTLLPRLLLFLVIGPIFPHSVTFAQDDGISLCDSVVLVSDSLMALSDVQADGGEQFVAYEQHFDGHEHHPIISWNRRYSNSAHCCWVSTVFLQVQLYANCLMLASGMSITVVDFSRD